MDFMEIVIQSVWVFALVVYSISITISTKHIYKTFRKKGMKKNVAIYYNRKIVHIFSGGISTLFVPFVFDSPAFPLLIGLVLAVFTYLPYHRGKLLYWIQTEENMNDVKFCLMWGVIVFLLWSILGSPWIAIIPPSMMAFGDGITGVTRNLYFKKRTKHPLGNVFMLMVCLPIGYFFGNIEGMALWGVIAAFTASFIERYEFGPIDDNILITTSTTFVLLIGSIL